MLEMWGDAYKPCRGYDKDPFNPLKHNFNSLKTHDLGLDDQPINGWNVLFQWRNPLDAVPSWFDWETRHIGTTDTYETWRAWAPDRFVFAGRLYRKWARHPKTVMILRHEELQQNPEVHAHLVGNLIFGDWTAAPNPLQTRPRRASHHHKFRHYRASDFCLYAALMKHYC